jgi:ribonuclease HI
LSRPRKRKVIAYSTPLKSGLPKSVELDYKKKAVLAADIDAVSDRMQLTLYFDGLCEPRNPGGIPVYAFIVRDSSSEQVLAKDAGLAGEPWTENATHNLAEYTAAIMGVRWAKVHAQTAELSIHGDSELVIRQVNKVYKVKSPKMLPLFTELTGLLNGLSWKAVWVPRAKNSQADKLANDFYREYCIKHHRKILLTMRERGAI